MQTWSPSGSGMCTYHHRHPFTPANAVLLRTGTDPLEEILEQRRARGSRRQPTSTSGDRLVRRVCRRARSVLGRLEQGLERWGQGHGQWESRETAASSLDHVAAPVRGRAPGALAPPKGRFCAASLRTADCCQDDRSAHPCRPHARGYAVGFPDVADTLNDATQPLPSAAAAGPTEWRAVRDVRLGIPAFPAKAQAQARILVAPANQERTQGNGSPPVKGQSPRLALDTMQSAALPEGAAMCYLP